MQRTLKSRIAGWVSPRKFAVAVDRKSRRRFAAAVGTDSRRRFAAAVGTDSRRRFAAAVGITIALSACGKTGSDEPKCVDSDPGCGVACNSSHPCASGLYCGGDGLCAKACVADRGCGPNQRCNENGECVPGVADASSPDPNPDAGSSEPSEGGSGIDNPGALRDAGMMVTDPEAGSMQPGTCQSADVSATRVIPTVVIVVDQSASMNDPFGNAGSRWNVLRDFLLKPDGLIASLQSQISFGLAMYSASGGNNNPSCPLVEDVKPVINNFDAIKTLYMGAEPVGDTPTGDSIDKIVAGLPKAMLDSDNGPVVLILATDGEPDRCEELNPQNGQMEAIAAVQRAFQEGIRTFILSVGNEVSIQHQQDVANAGVGHKDGEPNAPYWTAGDDATLRTALTEIISGQVSCDVALKGEVQGGDPCEGSVTLNSMKLECKGSDGWELTDPTHIRLLGKACSDFKTQKSAQVHATFPCSVQVVF